MDKKGLGPSENIRIRESLVVKFTADKKPTKPAEANGRALANAADKIKGQSVDVHLSERKRAARRDVPDPALRPDLDPAAIAEVMNAINSRFLPGV